MLLGRFFMHIPILAIAGNLAKKKITPESAGTFPVTGGCSPRCSISTILIVSALTFFPASSLGPILEHLLMQSGKGILRHPMTENAQAKALSLADPKILRGRDRRFVSQTRSAACNSRTR